MTIVTAIMGAVLHRELRDRGITPPNAADCEAIIAAVLEKSAKIADTRTLTEAEAAELAKRGP